MTHIASIVLILGLCLPQTLIAGVVLEAGEIDSNKVKVGTHVEVTYYKGEKPETTRGYIKAVDSETLTIGNGLWKDQIAFERIQKLILAEPDHKIDRLKTTDTLSVRKENKRLIGLMFEVGWNQGINTSSRNIFSEYSSSLDPKQKSKEGLPWSVSLYFGHIVSGERIWRFGLKYARQVVQVLPENPAGLPPQPRDGKTYSSSSLLLVYQHVVKSSSRVVLLADLEVGIALIGDYFTSGHNSSSSYLPEIGPRYSAGIALLLPIHSHIGLQATVRADLLRVKYKYPFTSGMSVAFGLLWG